MSLLSIVIPTFNRESILKENLHHLVSLLGNIPDEIELIVVNDNKLQNSNLLSNSPFRKYVVNNPKQGVSSARNYGASIARGKNLIFADDDVLITEEALNAAIRFLKENDSCRVLNTDWIYPDVLNHKARKDNFGRFLISRNLNSLMGWMGPNSNWKPNEIFEVSGAASYFLAISKATFQILGGYDENFPFAGFEDEDFATRLNQINVTTILNTKVRVYHNESDRLEIGSWIQRKYREGASRSVSVALGKNQYHISPPVLKRIIFTICYKGKLGIYALLQLLKPKFFDPLSFRIITALEGAAIWHGYKEYTLKN